MQFSDTIESARISSGRPERTEDIHVAKAGTTNDYYAADRQEWRNWLMENHAASKGVWLVYHKKRSGKPSVSYDEAVEEALAFGWIDSTVNTIDGERYKQYFSPRHKGSIWSKINKRRVEKVIAEGRMTSAGLEKIEQAKKDGAWTILDDVEDMLMPPDLIEALQADPPPREHFDNYPDALKKQMLYWIASAKRPETREKRIRRVIEAAAGNKSPFE
jgi:uncharacterized protein YdeI (YjbR/CyaY-like superfamily)